MLGKFRASAKFFTIGLVLGILLAPDSGENVRKRIVQRARQAVPGSSADA